jgi:hypothetical protein
VLENLKKSGELSHRNGANVLLSLKQFRILSHFETFGPTTHINQRYEHATVIASSLGQQELEIGGVYGL